MVGAACLYTWYQGVLIFHILQFVVTNVATILIPLWGMVGIWTNKLG